MHEEAHLSSSAFITDVAIGMSDGLTVPFALAAGLSAAVSSNATILAACFAAIVSGSVAMGFGRYFAGHKDAYYPTVDSGGERPEATKKLGTRNRKHMMYLLPSAYRRRHGT